MPDGSSDILLTSAPLFDDVCPPAPEGAAFWVHASDGTRIRLGAFHAPEPKGTVLIFPGRSEYVEKYVDAAQELATRGFSSLSIDWRGQGLADRALDDPRIGHVEHFRDYQLDVAAMLKAAEHLDLPKPWFLLGHSMGGCIGLRSLLNGLDVNAVAFTGPMWGIRIAPALQPVAYVLKNLLPAIGLGHQMPPTTQAVPYVINAPFEDNTLTRDPAMWRMMQEQLEQHPNLSLGGPTIVWLREALAECNDLARQPSPNLPCIAFLGSNERIVETGRIHARMSSWPGATLEIVENAEHEILMETPAIRTATYDAMAQHFSAAL